MVRDQRPYNPGGALPQDGAPSPLACLAALATAMRASHHLPMPDRHGHAFSAVDMQPDPDGWVSVLDRVRQAPFYRAYKARVMELLAPQLGRCYLGGRRRNR
jgi:hypothetical protein